MGFKQLRALLAHLCQRLIIKRLQLVNRGQPRRFKALQLRRNISNFMPDDIPAAPAVKVKRAGSHTGGNTLSLQTNHCTNTPSLSIMYMDGQLP